MATKIVIQQPKPLVLAPGSDQWSTSICECDNLNDCECIFFMKITMDSRIFGYLIGKFLLLFLCMVTDFPHLVRQVALRSGAAHVSPASQPEIMENVSACLYWTVSASSHPSLWQ